MGKLDLEQATKHLKLLGSLDNSDTFWFESRDDLKGKDKRKVLEVSGYDSLKTGTAWISRLNKQGAGVFVAVNPISEGRRITPNVGGVALCAKCRRIASRLRISRLRNR